jgi:16S rRNA (guanine(1405)-N(7))-methyltransferase
MTAPGNVPVNVADALVERVVAQVLQSRKYRAVLPHLVAQLARAELAKGRSAKDAVKATKNQLHQSAAAYQSSAMPYPDWLAHLAAIHTQGDDDAWRQALRQIMAHHASTQERLPILDDFYTQIFAHLPPIRTVLDIACGLNPLALPWMPLPPDAHYRAWDIFADQIDFLNRFFALAHLPAQAEQVDALAPETWPLPDQEPVDLAILLKTIPCLEQMDPTAGQRLLDRLPAHHLLISFPVTSLGGRDKGMRPHYEARFARLLADRPWPYKKLPVDQELVYLVWKVQKG